MPSGSRWGYLFGHTMIEPSSKRAVAFFDGQNLFRHAKDAFGHYHPNYDPKKLFEAICQQQSWINHGIRFYTGTPSYAKDPDWHGYWTHRLLAMRRSGIIVESRPLRYRSETITLPDGSIHKRDFAQEKGIDIRIALDIFRLSLGNQMDVAVIFSQDQDLSEVAKEIKFINSSQNRWMKIVSAFPSGPHATSERGIDGTDWIKIDQQLYNSCLDPQDYRPAKSLS